MRPRPRLPRRSAALARARVRDVLPERAVVCSHRQESVRRAPSPGGRGARGSRGAAGGRSAAARRCRARSWPAAARAGAGRGRRSRSGCDPCRDRARRPRAPLGRTRTSDTAPWLVTWRTPGRRSTTSRRSIGARSAANVGWPRWSSTNAQPVVLGRPGAGWSSPCWRRARRTPTTCARSVASGPASRSPAELRPAVDRQRVGLVPLVVRRRPCRRRTRSRSRCGRGGRRRAAHASATQRTPSALTANARSGSRLAGVDRGPRRAVDDGVRAQSW